VIKPGDPNKIPRESLPMVLVCIDGERIVAKKTSPTSSAIVLVYELRKHAVDALGNTVEYWQPHDHWQSAVSLCLRAAQQDAFDRAGDDVLAAIGGNP
jgi:hypothetical protein